MWYVKLILKNLIQPYYEPHIFPIKSKKGQKNFMIISLLVVINNAHTDFQCQVAVT
jgi:hypothetical protein